MSKRIALVEDDLAIRENYAAALTKQGYEVVGYADKPSAEAAFNQRLAVANRCVLAVFDENFSVTTS